MCRVRIDVRNVCRRPRAEDILVFKRSCKQLSVSNDIKYTHKASC